MNGVCIGLAKADLDTPTLCIDLNRMEANLERTAKWMQARGKVWRPHAKCHKSPAIAHRQLQAGAIGVTCAKVSEAEIFAQAGIRDLLIANMIVGDAKWRRLAVLARWADPIVACDHPTQVRGLSRHCQQEGTTCRVIIEIDLGMNRVGLSPGPAVLELAQMIANLPGLQFAGLMGYEGHLLAVADPVEKQTKIQAAMSALVAQKTILENTGLACPIVSVGGTGSFQITADCPGVTELQAGGAIFADPMYQERCGLVGYESALSVLVTIVSRPAPERVVVDSGRKSIHPDIYPPRVKDIPDLHFQQFSAEHGVLRAGPAAPTLEVGQKIELQVGYADFTSILYPQFVGLRNDHVETIWPVQARGMIQ